jgi:plasmid stabilization system protein ParE
VTRRRVRFTATARDHVRLLKQWWQENSLRPEIPHQDLEEALRMLSILPGIGSVYPAAPIAGVHRFYLERLMSHLYYTYDERELVIRALWHARRGSGPDFGSVR